MFKQSLFQRHSTLIFFLATFLISWSLWVPMALTGTHSRLLLVAGTFGPASAALLLTWLEGGRQGLGELLKRLLIWRVSLVYYVFSFLATAAVVMAAIGIHTALGGTIPVFSIAGKLYLAIPVFLYVLFMSVLGEEIGWRGFALPRLQRRHNALTTSLIIGLVWGLWHLPLFLMGDNFHKEIPISLFLLQDVALSIVLTWLYNSTGGSLLMVHLFHAASNTTLGLLPIMPMNCGGQLRPLWIAVILLCLIAVIIIALNGQATLSRNGIAYVQNRVRTVSKKI